ncbi:MAG: single-stranded DNA-binding protein [Planctomycetes bacterium]|nr:single-stranded DNA-binding protein [Planctomycetota bacterium]
MAESFARILDDLNADLAGLRFAPPVSRVYNPLVYARRAHDLYLRRYGGGRKEVVLLGMNPGPWGMAQTGVPFGEVEHVRDWLGIDCPIDRPEQEHPKRPIEGFACRRSEVSGRRLWGFFRDHYPDPADFFARFLVINYCPLVFMEEGGRNFTPDKLPAAEREPLFAACDRALRRQVVRLAPRLVVGVGAFARDRAGQALSGLELDFGTVLHPSPASPAANRGWAEAATAQLAALGVELP